MSNKSDASRNIEFEDFRKGIDPEAIVVPIILPPEPILPSGDMILGSIPQTTIKKVLGGSYKITDFMSGLETSAEEAVLKTLSKVVRKDLSYKGMGLRKKAKIRKDIIQKAKGLAENKLEEFGIDEKIKDYNIMGLASVATQSGIKKIFTDTLKSFPDTIDTKDLAKTSKDVFRVLDAKHSVDALLDLGNSTIADIVKSNGSMTPESIRKIYDASTSTGKVPDFIDKLQDTMGNLTGLFNDEEDISFIGKGKMKKDVEEAIATVDNKDAINRTVPDHLNTFELTTLF